VRRRVLAAGRFGVLAGGLGWSPENNNPNSHTAKTRVRASPVVDGVGLPGLRSELGVCGYGGWWLCYLCGVIGCEARVPFLALGGSHRDAQKCGGGVRGGTSDVYYEEL